jgi:hypothetical protein
MAKARINCTIDKDLAERFKNMNLSALFNETLRTMANTGVNVPFYSRRKVELERRLEVVDGNIKYTSSVIKDANRMIEEFTIKQHSHEIEKQEIEKELSEIIGHIEDNSETDLKLQLTFEINNAIRHCDYNREDIERTASGPINQMKKLVPAFDIAAQIKLLKDWS